MGNAKQAAHFYRTAMGFSITAYAGPETKVRDRASYVLEQGKIRFVLTAPMLPEGEIAEHVFKHGDGVKDIALRVPDVDYAYHTAVERGARACTEPHDIESEKGRIRKAAIAPAAIPSTPSSTATTTRARSCPATTSARCRACPRGSRRLTTRCSTSSLAR